MSGSIVSSTPPNLDSSYNHAGASERSDVEMTLLKGAPTTEIGAPSVITVDDGSSKVTLSVQSMTMARLDPDHTSVFATIRKVTVLDGNASATEAADSSVSYSRQLAQDMFNALNGQSGSDGQTPDAALSITDVELSSNGASQANIKQFVDSLGTGKFA